MRSYHLEWHDEDHRHLSYGNRQREKSQWATELNKSKPPKNRTLVSPVTTLLTYLHY